MGNTVYENKKIERKYLNNIPKSKFWKVRINLLELEKDFIELKERELKDREGKTKWEIEELFFEPSMVSIDDMDKFEQKEMKKIRPNKNTWYDWLINYIPKTIKKV